MRLLSILTSLALVAVPLAAQSASPVSKLGVLADLPGEWEGEAWMIIGPGPEGRRVLRQQEWISTAAGGTVVVVKGLGTEKMPDGSWVTRHDAFATIYMGRDGKPAMRAFLADGSWLDMGFDLVPDGYTWTMNHPRAGLVRYDMRVVDGKWVEKGFASRDAGTTWNQFMEMTLVRKENR